MLNNVQLDELYTNGSFFTYQKFFFKHVNLFNSHNRI